MRQARAVVEECQVAANVRPIDAGQRAGIEQTLGLLAACGVPAPRPVRWCMLRMAGQRTLTVARSLQEAGLAVWTPSRIVRRTISTGKGATKKVETEVAILPTFVFARANDEADLVPLATIIAEDRGVHPPFSLFRFGGRIPFVSDADVLGLQDEERRHAELLRAELEAESREAARALRVEAMRTERERQKALRRVHKDLPVGAAVEVAGMPALTGKFGEVVASNGSSAMISFGGGIAWKIEAWRLSLTDVMDCPAPSGAAA